MQPDSCRSIYDSADWQLYFLKHNWLIAVCFILGDWKCYTDMRKSIDGLAAIVQTQFHLDPLPATMANWIIRCTEDYLLPVVECLRKQLLAREVIHCDETPVQVLKEAGKKPQTKSYMWLYCTGEEAQAPIIVYDYQPSRNGDHAENAIRPFAVGRKNWLFADSPKGASASAAVYSIVETAKANNLHPYSYLEYLLLYMPDTDWRNHPEELDALMPWADAVQSQCHIPQSD